MEAEEGGGFRSHRCVVQPIEKIISLLDPSGHTWTLSDLITTLSIRQGSSLCSSEIALGAIEHAENFEANTEDNNRCESADGPSTVIVEVLATNNVLGRRVRAGRMVGGSVTNRQGHCSINWPLRAI